VTHGHELAIIAISESGGRSTAFVHEWYRSDPETDPAGRLIDVDGVTGDLDRRSERH
jgi:hypothetical protein